MAEIVNDLNNQPHAKSDDANNQNEENAMMITPLQQDELDHTMETLSKKKLYWWWRFWSTAVKIIRKDHSE